MKHKRSIPLACKQLDARNAVRIWGVNIVRIIAALWLVIHFTLTVLYVFPITPLKAPLQPLIDATIGTYFPQNWHLFAPNPITSDLILLVRPLSDNEFSIAQTKGLPSNGWYDILSPLWSKDQSNRFSAYEKLSRTGLLAVRSYLSDPYDNGAIQLMVELASAFCKDIGQSHTSYVALTIHLGPTLGGAVDTVFTTDASTFCVVFILILGALGLLFGYGTRVATFLILVSYHLLIIRLPDYSDGGDEIAGLVLVYMLFLLPHRAKFSPGQLQVWLHNIAVLAIILQLMVMYTASGFFKSIGELWLQGTAMYYITQVQQFTLPGANELFSILWIVYTATYLSMFYQLVFPVAILTHFKLLWIVLGALFHVSIAVLTGLVTFSMVMIGLELFLISDQEYARIWHKTITFFGQIVPLSP